MSAGKLGRFAGLVFVLAAFAGGVGAASSGAEHENGGLIVRADNFQADSSSTGPDGGDMYLPYDFSWT